MSSTFAQMMESHYRDISVLKEEGYFGDMLWVRVDEAYTELEKVTHVPGTSLKMLGYFKSGEEFLAWVEQNGVTRLFCWRLDDTHSTGHGTTEAGVDFRFEFRRPAKKGKSRWKPRGTPRDHSDRNQQKDWSKPKGEKDRRSWG